MIKKIKNNKLNLALITLGICTIGVVAFLFEDLFLILGIGGIAVVSSIKS